MQDRAQLFPYDCRLLVEDVQAEGDQEPVGFFNTVFEK
jgi:hypothetical protein